MPKSSAQKQERRTAKELDGRATPASGARWHSKGDVRAGRFLIECKTTEKDFYRLTAKTWDKICREALRDGMREPAMRIDLRDEHRDVRSYAVVSLESYVFALRHEPGPGLKLVRCGSSSIRSALAVSIRDFAENRAATVLLSASKGREPDCRSVAVLPWAEFLRHVERMRIRDEKFGGGE